MVDELRNAASEAAQTMMELMLDLETLDELLEMVADDFVLHDRRKLVGAPEIDKATFAKINVWVHSEVGLASRDREVLAVRGDRLVLTRLVDRHRNGSTREFLGIGDFGGDPVQARRAVMFDLDDLDLAMEELDRLHAEIGDDVPSVSDRIENAALQSLVSILEYQNAAGPDDAAPEGRDDFFIDDRTRGAASAGIVTAQEALEWFRAAFDVADGARPRWDVLEVLGVRGERLAAVLVQMTYGNDLGTKETVVIEQLDETLVPERAIYYSPEDADLALAELDRLHAEIEASHNPPPAP